MNYTGAIDEAINLRLKGDTQGAIELLEAAVESLRKSAQLKAWPLLVHDLAAACEEGHQPDLGLRYVRECLAAFPNELSLLYVRASLLIVSGRKEEARSALESFRTACASSGDALREGWAELQAPLERRLA